MKKLLFGVIVATLFSSPALLANNKIYKSHLTKERKELVGKDDVKINCSYCHKRTGAGVPRKKGQDIAEFYKTPYCGIKGCHLQ